MSLNVKPDPHWHVRELVVLGVFAAAAKLSTLLLALAGGGFNPMSLLLKNVIFTTFLVIMLYKVRKTGTLTLFILINLLVSALLLGIRSTLLPAMLGGALIAECLIFCTGGPKQWWAPVLAAGIYDLISKCLSVVMSWLVFRETPGMVYITLGIVGLGYIGSLIGLVSGVRAVKELRHAGLIRQ